MVWYGKVCYGIVWFWFQRYFTIFGHFWGILGHFGPIVGQFWANIRYCVVWYGMVLYGMLWFWPFLSIVGHFCSFIGYLWPLLAIFGQNFFIQPAPEGRGLYPNLEGHIYPTTQTTTMSGRGKWKHFRKTSVARSLSILAGRYFGLKYSQGQDERVGTIQSWRQSAKK